MEFHKQVKSNFQTVEIQKLVSATGTEIKLLARSVNGGWIEYVFSIENQPAQKIIGLTIEPVDPPPPNQKLHIPPRPPAPSL